MSELLTMHPATVRLALRRVGAWLLDWMVILVWIGLLTVAGLVLDMRSWALTPGAWAATIALLTVVPVTLWLSWWEGRGQSPGKRMLRLEVLAPDDGTPGFGRALLRNALKVAVPWQLGHVVASRFIATSADVAVPAWAYAASVVVYVLMGIYVLGLFLGAGRPLYDVLAGTEVVVAEPRR